MSMTDTEITAAVTTRWVAGNLGLYKKAVSWYLVEMKGSYAKIGARHFENATEVSVNMLDIISYCWAALRWYGDFPVPTPPWWFPDSTGEPWLYPPRPLSDEIDTLPLDVSGVSWAALDKQEYNMMVSTYINQLADAWLDDTTDLWSPASTTAAQHLFQVCKQYLLLFGIADGTLEYDI
jgi:hypothetical protein